jgi:hypothetical protein
MRGASVAGIKQDVYATAPRWVRLLPVWRCLASGCGAPILSTDLTNIPDGRALVVYCWRCKAVNVLALDEAEESGGQRPGRCTP